MTKQLPHTLLFFSFLFVSSLQAQSIVFTGNVDSFNQDAVVSSMFELSENNELHKEKVFSYNFDVDHDSHNHEIHSESHDLSFSRISLIDIISSDEGADFNCSGGFCMDKSHFHKKGLTLKKQLFGYFMKISC